MVLVFILLLAFLAEAIGREIDRRQDAVDGPETPPCPRCGTAAEADWLICPRCRTLLRCHCAGCGQGKFVAHAFCPWCGTGKREEP